MIQITNLELLRGGKPLLKNANATLFAGHKVGLVGNNGCGKSSLFSLIRKELSPDSGECLVPKEWRIASVKQETPGLSISALEYVLQGYTQYYSLRQQLHRAEQTNDGAKLAQIHLALEDLQAYHIEAKASELLHGLGFTQQQISLPVKDFSGGWRMRLNLAQALIQEADLLLLDEPTNHLDLDAVYWLEKFLKNYPGTLVLISHDREFLDAIVGEIWQIYQQQVHTYKGNYSQFERTKAEKLAHQQSNYEKQQDQIAHLENFIRRFKAKATKAKQAQSRVKALERMEKLAPAHIDSPFDFSFKQPPSLPNPLVTLDKVKAGYGDKTIIQDIKLNLVPGSRIALLGKNGAGKSTLIKLLAGELPAQAGELVHHQGLRIGYFAQHQLESLDPNASAMLHLQRLDSQASEQELRDFLGCFAFHGDKALDPVSPFSGGEKARLVLALLVYQKPNMLLLDEPTNHLDLEMRHALVMALQGFEGAMVTVSHDRHLLKNTSDQFYLVNNGSVDMLGYEIEDYYNWLSNQDKSQVHVASDESDVNVNKVHNRKEQKRLEADFRKKMQPLKKQITQLESKLETLTEQLSAVEMLLADSHIYQEENKNKLTTQLAKQAELAPQLNDIEETLLEKLEILEYEETEFAAQFDA